MSLPLPDGFVLEFGRVSLLAHGTPQAGSIAASEVSTIPGEVQHSTENPTAVFDDGEPGVPEFGGKRPSRAGAVVDDQNGASHARFPRRGIISVADRASFQNCRGIE